MRRFVRLGPADPIWDQMVATGDWSIRPWFLETAWVDTLRLWGLRLSDLQDAVAALKRAYPPRIAKDLLNYAWEPTANTTLDEEWRRQDEQDLVLGLFTTIGIVPLIRVPGLGVDLAAVFAHGFDRDIARRLRDPASAAGADLEAQVWANALRAGWTVTKLDKPPRSGPKRPDLLVETGRVTASVEAKSLEHGDDVVLARRVHLEKALGFSGRGAPPDRDVHVRSAEDLYEAAADPARHVWFKERLSLMLEALAAKFDELEERNYPLGEHAVADFGTISVVEAESGVRGSIMVSLAGEKSSEDQAARAVRPLWKAARKPRLRRLPNVAFVDLPSLQENLVVRAVIQDLERRPHEYANLDGFIVRTVRQVFDGNSPPYVEWRGWAKALPWGALSPDELNHLGQELIRSPYRLAFTKAIAAQWSAPRS